MKFAFCDRVPLDKWCIQKYGHRFREWQVLAPYERPDRYGNTQHEFETFQKAVEFVSQFI